MGYDRQRSPFATRLFLTSYCLFLLVNILLYSNNICRIKNDKIKSEFETILLCFISLLIFFISFYGLWFANILILCLMALLFSILLGTTLISIILIIIKVSSNKIILLKTSLYFSHNYIWLIKSSTYLFSIISLSFSFLLNLIALYGICHLCSCVEHQHQYWPYRKRTSQNII